MCVNGYHAGYTVDSNPRKETAMPRGRGIYRDEPREKLEENIAAVEEDGDQADHPATDESGVPAAHEPPD